MPSFPRATAVLVTVIALASRSVAATDLITIGSDATWNVYASDPGTPPAVLLGTAQAVCLNAAAPNPCPAGAVVWGASSAAGWLADLSTIPGSQWVWAPGLTGASTPASPAQFFFATSFTLPGPPRAGSVGVAADDLAEVLVNGTSAGVVGSITDSIAAAQARNTLTTIDVTPLLMPGANNIVVRAANGPPAFAGCDPGPCTYAQNPAGVVVGGSFAFGPPNHPPDCSHASATPDESWPPNHKFVTVAVRGVTDPDGDSVRIAVGQVRQDEPVGGSANAVARKHDGNDDDQGDDDQGEDDGSGSGCPDAAGLGSGTVALRSERDGGGDGRVYHVAFTADDARGGRCTGEVTVCVPHDRGNGSRCVDGGPLYDATGPCGGCTAPATCGSCPSPWSCDDGDPCTVDVCTADGCGHDPMTGLPGCRCWIDDGWTPPPCSGVQLPAGIASRLATARRLVDGAEDTKRGRRAVAKALRQLRRAAALSRTAGEHALPDACATVVEQRIRSSRLAAKGWLSAARRR